MEIQKMLPQDTAVPNLPLEFQILHWAAESETRRVPGPEQGGWEGGTSLACYDFLLLIIGMGSCREGKYEKGPKSLRHPPFSTFFCVDGNQLAFALVTTCWSPTKQLGFKNQTQR